jgi:hypothetical protein
MDNNTVEKGFDEYVNQLCLNYSNIKVKKFTNRTRGELYRAMNWAIDYAIKEGYEIINFVQDDRQYLYDKKDHIDDIYEIFNNHESIGQINCNLAWRRKIEGIGKVVNIKVNNSKYGTLVDKRICDNGFTRLGLYDKIGRYPVDAISWGLEKNRYVGKINGEIWFGKKCYKRGYSRVLAYHASTGMVFDCAYVRGEERYGNYFKPKGEFYFKMLGSDHVKKIKDRAKKNKFSYIEDFCIPDGWKPKTYDKHGNINIKESIYG